MCLGGFGLVVQSGVGHQLCHQRTFYPACFEALRTRFRAEGQGINGVSSFKWSTWLHNMWCRNTLFNHKWVAPFQPILVTN